MRGWAKLAAAIAVVACLVLIGTPSAFSAPSDLEARRDALLQAMISNPGNLDIAFEYAELSTQVGDYEGAVSTLERILIFAPNTPSLQLELGILYYRMGAYDVARSYFAQALANPATPPDVANKIKLYLQQLALLADPPAFSAVIFSGIRWESNANSGPASQTVTLSGIDFTLDDTSVAKPGWSAVNTAALHYDFDLKQGDRIDFDFLTYNATYFDLTEANLNFFEATLGPSFNLKRFGINASRFFAYGIGTEVLMENSQYFGAGGGGLRFLSFAAERSVLDVRVETRVREYSNTRDNPTNSLRDGPQTRFGGYYTYYLGPGLSLVVQAYAQREDAKVGYYANWELGASGGIAWTFANPIAVGRYPWTLQVGAGGIQRNYDDPDPVISATQTESDTTFWGRAAVIIPVSDTLAMVPQIEYRDQNSNYEISRFDDFSALVGLQKRF
jgi:hypothetical protein